MAVKNEAATKLILKVEDGVDAKGKKTYANRSFQHINPALGDDDLLALGQALGSLQERTVGAVTRTDTASLIAG